MQTHTITTYTFDELDDHAKEKARQWYREGELDYDWWDSTYEDAERVGLKITAFNLGRGQLCEGELTGSVNDSVQAILTEHGPACDTYKLAQDYYQRRHDGQPMDEDEFRERLLGEYYVMLEREYEWLLSDESVDESIAANEYEFTTNGNVYC